MRLTTGCAEQPEFTVVSVCFWGSFYANFQKQLVSPSYMISCCSQMCVIVSNEIVSATHLGILYHTADNCVYR